MRRSVAVGLGVAAAVGAAVGLASRGSTLMPWPTPVRRAFPAVVGTVAGGSVGLVTGSAVALAQGRVPSWRRAVVGVSAALALGGGVTVAAGRALRMIEERNRRIDPDLGAGPASPLVSGSEPSLLHLSELGREGVRFVSFAVDADRRREVSASDSRVVQQSPIRVFVGADSAETDEQRVALAMAELRRTGAFHRRCLLVLAPAGTGYANGVPVDALEILTNGDCATVVLGFGLLPSFLSLRKIPLAARGQQLLLDAISAEAALSDSPPRILLYGESLGASIQQAGVPAGPTDLDAFRVSAALWVGTPGGQVADAMHARCADESIVLDRPEQIPDPPRVRPPRVWFLEHDGDPVVRFRPRLLLSRPAWLPGSGQRGRGIPEGMRFRPLITYLQTLVDTLFATDVEPGEFASIGHDYRADLGPVVMAAYGLPAPEGLAADLSTVLAELEARRAQMLT